MRRHLGRVFSVEAAGTWGYWKAMRPRKEAGVAFALPESHLEKDAAAFQKRLIRLALMS